MIGNSQNPNVEEINICGHIVIREKIPDCPKCGKQMMNIMCYGLVCIDCDKPKKP